MHNFNNRPCHWNKSQAFSGSGPSHANSNFISPRQKIEAGGINLWSIPNISPTIWEALAGLLYISMGDANNLLEMYYITPRRMTKLATAQSDENKPNRTLQFHGDTAWCNEVTLWLPSSLRERVQCHPKCKKSQCKVTLSNSLCKLGLPCSCSNYCCWFRRLLSLLSLSLQLCLMEFARGNLDVITLTFALCQFIILDIYCI